MCEKYGSDWQNTQPNFTTSVVAESTGGKPHWRYAIADSLITKPSKSKKRPRPKTIPTEHHRSFYTSV